MKKFFLVGTAIIALSVIGFLGVHSGGDIDSHQKLTFNKSEITFIKTLKTPDGTILGDINVLNLHSASNSPESGRDLSNVFDALYLTKQVDGKDIVLYKINNEGFFNTLGKDQEIANGDFYGFQFAELYEDHFVLHMLQNGGKNISDDATIVWNATSSVFEIYRPHADIPAQLGNLVASDGSPLGEIEGIYIDESSKLFDSLFIFKMIMGQRTLVYQVTHEGFFNTNGKEVILANISESRGFKISQVQDDHFVLNYLSKDGKYVSSDITVKWNYSKKVFEVQNVP